MGFFKSVFKVATGRGSKVFDPLGLWGDGGKAADEAENRQKVAEAEAAKAKLSAAEQEKQTREAQMRHEQSLKEIAANAKLLSDANNARGSTGTTNVVIGGSASASSLLKKRKGTTSLSSTLGINY